MNKEELKGIATKILETWNKKDLVADALNSMNFDELVSFVKDNEEVE